MADFNSIFAASADCALRVSVEQSEAAFGRCHNSLHRLNKDRKRRAKKTHVAGANCCSGHKNAVTDCDGHRHHCR